LVQVRSETSVRNWPRTATFLGMTTWITQQAGVCGSSSFWDGSPRRVVLFDRVVCDNTLSAVADGQRAAAIIRAGRLQTVRRAQTFTRCDPVNHKTRGTSPPYGQPEQGRPVQWSDYRGSNASVKAVNDECVNCSACERADSLPIQMQLQDVIACAARLADINRGGTDSGTVISSVSSDREYSSMDNEKTCVCSNRLTP
jgi:hypothetical protein